MWIPHLPARCQLYPLVVSAGIILMMSEAPLGLTNAHCDLTGVFADPCVYKDSFEE